MPGTKPRACLVILCSMNTVSEWVKERTMAAANGTFLIKAQRWKSHVAGALSSDRGNLGCLLHMHCNWCKLLRHGKFFHTGYTQHVVRVLEEPGSIGSKGQSQVCCNTAITSPSWKLLCALSSWDGWDTLTRSCKEGSGETNSIYENKSFRTDEEKRREYKEIIKEKKMKEVVKRGV